jgi:threonine synthase
VRACWKCAGRFDDALRLCRELGEQDGFVVVNSLNPDRIEGQKTVSFELIDQLGGAPDVVALPFGGGGNVSAVARGSTRRARARASSSARRRSARRPGPRRSGSVRRRTPSAWPSSSPPAASRW